jgi:hypothetical protein
MSASEKRGGGIFILSSFSLPIIMKTAIVLSEALGKGHLANAAACIITGLFKDENADEVYGAGIEGADCNFIPITKIPILILRQGHKDFEEILTRAKENNLKHMIFTHEGQSTASYDEYVNRVNGKPLAELTIIGIGIIGDDKTVTKCVGDLPLFK